MQRHYNNRFPELRKITFWFKDSNTVCMRGIQFEHEAQDGSTRVKSPMFDTGDAIQCKYTVGKEVLRHTRSVSACCRETQLDSIKSLSFIGKKGVVLDEVNHYRREIGVPLQPHRLAENEEIIGGYGVSNK